MSLREIANELGISPAYLSYMVNGKRPWRRDLYERYSYLVNTSVNSRGLRVVVGGSLGADLGTKSAIVGRRGQYTELSLPDRRTSAVPLTRLTISGFMPWRMGSTCNGRFRAM